MHTRTLTQHTHAHTCTIIHTYTYARTQISESYWRITTRPSEDRTRQSFSTLIQHIVPLPLTSNLALSRLWLPIGYSRQIVFHIIMHAFWKCISIGIFSLHFTFVFSLVFSLVYNNNGFKQKLSPFVISDILVSICYIRHTLQHYIGL